MNVQMFKNILVPLDGSETAEGVLSQVEAIVKECNVNSIVFLRVLEPMFHGSKEAISAFSEAEMTEMEVTLKDKAEEYLTGVLDRFSSQKISLHSEITIGFAAESIIDYTAQHDISLLVIATHGRSGVSRWVMGSVAERVLRSSNVPVIMVRNTATEG